MKHTIESIEKENYRIQIEQMVNDPMVISDIEEVEDDFKYVDGELNAFSTGSSAPAEEPVLEFR